MILGNFIFNYVVNRVLAENHPTKDYDRCINRRQVKHICTVCQEVCPVHVYSGPGGKKADFTECMNCNLCVTACPARCIASSAMNVSSYLKLLRIPEGAIYIASRQYERTAHLRVDYFAALSWEYLACIGLRKKVVFLTDAMPDITLQAEEVWQKTLANLTFFFGNKEFDKRFLFSEKLQLEDSQQISRRELFKKANEELKSKISFFVPSESMMDGLLYRYLLKETLIEMGSKDSFGWVVPIITSKCKGCNVCSSLCPQNAITVKKDNGQFRLFFYPFRCNHCGLCQKVCIRHAVNGFGLSHINNLKPMLLFDSAVDGGDNP